MSGCAEQVGEYVSENSFRQGQGRPLEGLRVLVTRPRHQAQALCSMLEDRGALTLSIPTLQIEPASNEEHIRFLLSSLNQFAWIIFTSANGVEAFLHVAQELKVSLKDFSGKVACIGPATASALEVSGRPADVVPHEFISDALPQYLGDVQGQKILLARTDKARRALNEELLQRGAYVADVVVYRSRLIDGHDLQEASDALLAFGRPDVLTFTSPLTVKGLQRVFEQIGWQDAFQSIPSVSIGPITSRALAALGAQERAVAKVYTIDGLVDVLEQEFSYSQE